MVQGPYPLYPMAGRRICIFREESFTHHHHTIPRNMGMALDYPIWPQMGSLSFTPRITQVELITSNTNWKTISQNNLTGQRMEKCGLLGVERMAVWSVSRCLYGSNKPSNLRNHRWNSLWLSTWFGRDLLLLIPAFKASSHCTLESNYVPILQYCIATSNSFNYFGESYWMQCNTFQQGLFLMI